MNDFLIPKKAADWIATSQSARLLHLFDRSCNVVNQHGALLSLVLPSVGLGPFSIIIPEFVLRRLYDGERLEVGAGRLTVGDWGLGIGDWDTIWDAVPQWGRLRGQRFDNGRYPKFSQPIETNFAQLLDGLANNKEEVVQPASFRLAGLGGGLTPTGDDLLMGVLYALWVYRPESHWIELIGKTVVPRTTTLSAAFLQAAIDGEATMHWHNLANEQPNSIKNILAIGETSGVDAWRGFTRTTSLLQDQKHQNDDPNPQSPLSNP